MTSRPNIIGHRGASVAAPENTIAAFELALKQGADGVELDAKLTRDGKVVVIHDASVDRTSNGVGFVKELDYNSVKKLDAGSKFSEKYIGERIPLLEEVFEAVGRKLLINIELTNYANPKDDLPEKVADLVNLHDIHKYVFFSSFHPITLLRIRKLLPEVPAGILALPGAAGALSRSIIGKWLTPQLVHPFFSDVSESFVKRQQKMHRGINVWTVNNEKDIRRMIELSVNGIITDDVKLALKICKSR